MLLTNIKVINEGSDYIVLSTLSSFLSAVITYLMLLPLWESVIVLCFVVRYFMSILVLQSS